MDQVVEVDAETEAKARAIIEAEVAEEEPKDPCKEFRDAVIPLLEMIEEHNRSLGYTK